MMPHNRYALDSILLRDWETYVCGVAIVTPLQCSGLNVVTSKLCLLTSLCQLYRLLAGECFRLAGNY